MGKRLILIVEDDPAIARIMRVAVTLADFACHISPDGDAALRDFESLRPSLVLLDLGLPGIPGLELLEQIRRARPDLPVIIVTSDDEELSELLGLEKGADDYITKPVRPQKLIARIRAVLRRCSEKRQSPDDPLSGSGKEQSRIIRVHAIEIDPHAYSCEVNGTPVDLTSSEFAMLHCLMLHPNWTHPRERIAEHIYHEDPPANMRAIDYIASPLRKKLRPLLNNINAIVSKSGTGYRINPVLLEPER